MELETNRKANQKQIQRNPTISTASITTQKKQTNPKKGTNETTQTQIQNCLKTQTLIQKTNRKPTRKTGNGKTKKGAGETNQTQTQNNQNAKHIQKQITK